MKKKICFLLMLFSIIMFKQECLAENFKAQQHTETHNVYIEGQLDNFQITEGIPVTLILYNVEKIAYINEIKVNEKGQYKTKFKYQGDASMLSMDVKYKGENVNDSVLTIVSNRGSIVESKAFLINQKGAAFQLNDYSDGMPVHTVGRHSYRSDNRIESTNGAGAVVYVKNTLGGDLQKFSVLVVQYDKNNRMLDCYVENNNAISFNAYDEFIKLEINNINLKKDMVTVKVFVWENTSGIIPFGTYSDGTLDKVKMHVVGDSTYQSWPAVAFPQSGIGDYMVDYFNSDYLAVVNKAVSGASVATYLDDNPALGYWPDVINNVSKGDYVYIALGINDLMSSQSSEKIKTYEDGLQVMIDNVLYKEAIPILGTPIIPANSTSSGYVEIAAYVKAAYGALSRVAEKNDIVLLPICEIAYEQFKTLGTYEATRRYHLSFAYLKEDWGLTDEEILNHLNSNVKNNQNDTTHLNARGADVYAQIITQALFKSDSPLRFYVK